MNYLGINRKVRTVVSACTLLFMPFILFGQNDTTVFKEVIVRANHLKVNQHTTLNETQIDLLAPHDLGSLLQYINGITIKSYGGIGGLKTLSHRGLGGEHTQLVVDGLPLNNPQSGQTNLANISLDNVEEVALNTQSSGQLVPVSGLVKGSAVELKTFDQKFSPHQLSIRSSLTSGSFGQREGFLALKKGGKKSFISFSGGYRTFNGDYPYQLSFSNETQNFIRRNNALEDYHLNIGAGIKWRKEGTSHQIKISGNRNSIDQDLPGAVILYNNMAQETLKTENNSAGLNYSTFNKSFALKAFAQFSNRFIHYNDPTYLNSEGYLDNQYTTNSFVSGIHIRYRWKKFNFHIGNDFGHDVLESNRNLGNPTRSSNTAMIKSSFQAKYFNIEASIFSQTFEDKNSTQIHRELYHKIHPQISFSTSDSLFKNIQLFIWYKPSSRAPSFNELYYSQVGNTSLVPEESSQLNFGTRFIKSFKKVELQFQGNIFKNLVSNKIVALPTQNLFVWSIQNVGKVDVFGGDIHLNANVSLTKNWKIALQAGASYQQALDISDENSPTYRDQIAYTPSLTGNATASIYYKKAGLHMSALYIGERFSLNENISANRLDPYLVFDFSGNYVFKLKEKQKIVLHAGVKNIANTSYNFIKYYVMPGRNYFIKLSYEFN